MFNDTIKFLYDTVLPIIRNNVSWVKDLLWIIFTFIATIIAIKTYKNAKRSVFQPIITKSIEKQISEINILSNKLKSWIETDFGLKDTFNITYYKAIIEIFSDCSIKEEKIKEIIDYKSEFNVISQNNSINYNKRNKKCIFKNKSKNIELSTIILSDDNTKIIQEVKTLINNPIIPSKLKKLLRQLLKNIYECYNIFQTELNTTINEVKESSENLVESKKNSCYNNCVTYIDKTRTKASEILKYVDVYYNFSNKYRMK